MEHELELLKFKKYSNYYIPVVIVDTELNIVYKNKSAREIMIRMPLGKNVRSVLDEENTQKVYELLITNKIINIKFDNKSVFNHCIVMNEMFDNMMHLTMIFFASINMDNFEFTNNFLTKILLSYNNEQYTLNQETSENLYKINSVSSTIEKETYLNFINNNTKKVIRLQKHMNSITSIYNNIETDEKYIDLIENYMQFKRKLPNYISPLGYTINFNSPEDNVYIMKLNRRDFLSLVLTLITITLNLADNKTLNLFFEIDKKTQKAYLNYYFKVSDKVLSLFKETYFKEFKTNTYDVNYLDFHYAFSLAEKNNARIELNINEENKNASMKLFSKIDKPNNSIVQAYIAENEYLDSHHSFEIELSNLIKHL